ncbi:MAG: type 1 glutamine amidotransferase [Chloroflexi bacterium]|nr:MAG: type 1 glutamine amidotransferase [Chloroflexota bacterium]RLC75009.1 MAG: type 1 glutamine amidotransferase [Chloroflexota bacterium]
MSINAQLAICIINGYPKTSRENFDRSNVGHPHDLYQDFLRRYTPQSTVDVLYAADPGVELPAGVSLDAYDGYIWTGSDLTIYHHDDARVTRQIKLAQAIFEAGVPSYGSCWGIQMAAVAAGGEVKKNPKGREWGLARNIQRTAEGRESLLLQGKPERYDGFTMHLDEVTRLPPGAKLLAVDEHTHVQALEVVHGKGVFWATQYHPEYNLREMARLISARADPLVKEGFFETPEAVQTYARQMNELHDNPDSVALRQELAVGDDILDGGIREQELRNWIDHLVLPSLTR